MKKLSLSLDPKATGLSLEKIKTSLEKQFSCYVLITCTEADAKGNMEVNFHFEGEEALAAFLLEKARDSFEEKCEMPLDSLST